MKKTLSLIRSIALILLGNVILAFTVKVFLMPVNLITGGATGIALAANHLWGVSVSLVVFIINIIMLIIGWLFLGKRFAITTLLSSVLYPLSLEVFDRLLGDWVFTDDIVLCTVFTGIGMGLALGIVFREGASTGGMDVLPLVLSKYFKLNVSVGMYTTDIIILLAQAVYGTPAEILYGILAILIYSFVMDRIILKGASKTELKIISSKYDAIRATLSKELDRTVTMLKSEGGYTHEPTEMVLSVVSNREVYRAEKIIRDIDPSSFIIITRVNEVKGRGFTLDKDYVEPETDK